MRHTSLATLFEQEPLIVPTENVIRAEFESLVSRLGVRPKIIASVDDMAMVRLLARAGVGVALIPSIVVADEAAAGVLKVAKFDLGISEPFFAVTLPRAFPHPALEELFKVSNP